ncbi:hypothetical protein HHK36_017672 [Tetracentron sinense]|uniref:Uncharacterized protein n=1 Tax=Tetracentron sinense TaxID=13715 RepID=A0A834YYK5_TETSI|nr:hypothetical protein HHK36_017672 [Tetracentron sinense]
MITRRLIQNGVRLRWIKINADEAALLNALVEGEGMIARNHVDAIIQTISKPLLGGYEECDDLKFSALLLKFSLCDVLLEMDCRCFKPLNDGEFTFDDLWRDVLEQFIWSFEWEYCIEEMPPKVSRGFSLFGRGGSFIFGENNVDGSADGLKSELTPSLELQTDKDMYRPGDSVVVTIEIRIPHTANNATEREDGADNIFSLLVERLAFEIKGIEKLDTQWFATQKLLSGSKLRRGEQVFLECSTPSIISNQIVSSGGTKTSYYKPWYDILECSKEQETVPRDRLIRLYADAIPSTSVVFFLQVEDDGVVLGMLCAWNIVRAELPKIIPPSYRGTTIRYLYYVRSTLSGRWLVLENGHSHRESVKDLIELPTHLGYVVDHAMMVMEGGHYAVTTVKEREARTPLQIWVTQKTSGLLTEEGQSDGWRIGKSPFEIANGLTPNQGFSLLQPSKWIFIGKKRMQSLIGYVGILSVIIFTLLREWTTILQARANEIFDGVEEGYESSRDEISSVSSYNLTKGNIETAFGSSLSLQSYAAKSSNKDHPYLQGQRSSLSSYMALPQLSVAEVLYDSRGGNKAILGN